MTYSQHGGKLGNKARIEVPYMSYISWKQAKVGFTKKIAFFPSSQIGMWASFPDLLNIIFAVFNFANGHRLTKYPKLNPPRNKT